MSGIICELVGMLRDVQYQRCRLILHELSVEQMQFLPRLHGLVESEYLEFLDAHNDVIPRDKRGQLQQTTHPFVLINGNTFVNGEDELLHFIVEKTQLSRDDVLAIAAFGGSRGILDSTKQWELAEETLQAKADTCAKQALFRSRQLSGNQFVYLIFDVDGVALPRVEIELFHRVCPRTCANFVAFCQGKVPDIADEIKMLGYQDNVVHRIVRGGWIQAGDVAHDGQGDGPCRSLYGRQFADESFSISHNAAGIVVRFCNCLSYLQLTMYVRRWLTMSFFAAQSMANTGPHTNGSQFFITLVPLPWLDRNKGMQSCCCCLCSSYFRLTGLTLLGMLALMMPIVAPVAFGRVVSGIHTILAIGNLETVHDRPCVPCKIVDCGLIE
uniref:PPIase cyclophilin-type domain-containing protein n=1 Tax=Globisporangium ultimum (strain ATCC 200006 / CBS 805.95 / DAOM BR144) TaxID=431595 RepID=K3WG28_GLOUD